MPEWAPGVTVGATAGPNILTAISRPNGEFAESVTYMATVEPLLFHTAAWRRSQERSITAGFEARASDSS